MKTICVPAWERYPWLRHGFTMRRGGVSACYGGGALNLGYTREDAESSVLENRGRVLASLLPAGALATMRQVHGAAVLCVAQGGPAGEAVGLATRNPGVLLGAQVADCVPILLIDRRLRAVAALHAGWRGTVAGIAQAGVEHMARVFGSRADDMEAAIGPSIGACCFAVGAEVAAHFPDACASRDGQLYVDLWQANRRQLEALGVLTHSVAACTACTFEVGGGRRFFSHRAEQGSTGRGMAVIGIADESAGT